MPGFAPDSLTDGRKPGDWKTRYTDEVATRQIRSEAVYLMALLLVAPMLILITWLGYPGKWLGIATAKNTNLSIYLYGWLGGMFGGTVFALKWLYHSVAKHIWNQDRLLWRLCTPLVSGALGLTSLIMVRSSVFKIFDSASLTAPSVALTVSILAGYLSDGFAAKLTELAQTFFGTTEQHKKQ